MPIEKSFIGVHKVTLWMVFENTPLVTTNKVSFNFTVIDCSQAAF